MKISLHSIPARLCGLQHARCRTLLAGCLLLLLCLYTVAPAAAQTPNPPLPPGGIIIDCGQPGDPLGDESPAGIDIVGATTPDYYYWSGVLWHDDDFLHFGLRVNGDPSGPNGFAQRSWVALINIPTGDPFQYQYVVSLNGNNVPGYSNDTVELWENDPGTAEDISFSPIFNDPAETNLIRIEYNDASLSSYPTDFCFGGNSLACSQTTTSTIGGDTDYLIFWAIPVSSLIDAGVINDASDLDAALFFLATSTDPNNYNKDSLLCPFAPPAQLTIDKEVTPDVLIQGGSTSLTYTIDVTNPATNKAVGVVIADNDVDGFDDCLTFPVNSVTIECLGANGCSGANLESDPPDLLVHVDELEAGGSVSLTIAADAANCPIPGSSLDNVATTFATNASETSDDAVVLTLLPVELVSFEAVLDGRATLLRWQTLSETNNAGFEVQHRFVDQAEKGASSFEALGFVEGAGTTLEAQSYVFEAARLDPGRHVFRLKQLDFDGTFAYSPEVEVLVEMPEAFVLSSIYPNPFNPTASFSVGVQREQQVEIAVYDVLGRRVLEIYRGVLPAGVTRVMSIEASGLGSGTYMLRALGETFAETQMFTVVK